MNITEAMEWVEKLPPQDEELEPEQEAWLEDNDDIIQEAISVYRAQFLSVRSLCSCRMLFSDSPLQPGFARGYQH